MQIDIDVLRQVLGDQQLQVVFAASENKRQQQAAIEQAKEIDALKTRAELLETSLREEGKQIPA